MIKKITIAENKGEISKTSKIFSIIRIIISTIMIITTIIYMIINRETLNL